jgi:hypothetical protein
MNNLFNARDAKALAKLNDPDELLKVILEEIKYEASEGKYEYITRDRGFGEGALYDIEDNYHSKIKNVLTSLRDLGFDAQIITDCRQFVDIYLRVSWAD